MKVSDGGLPTCRLVQTGDARALGRLFERLERQGVGKFFHPHPLTREAAAERAAYMGKDLYCVLEIGMELVGYGILHGWDKGYEIPGLGIAIDPDWQGRGYGRLFMQFLHELARRRGAKRIRLRVYPENLRAVQFYRSLGYALNDTRDPDGQIVGFVDLHAPEPPKAGEKVE